MLLFSMRVSGQKYRFIKTTHPLGTSKKEKKKKKSREDMLFLKSIGLKLFVLILRVVRFLRVEGGAGPAHWCVSQCVDENFRGARPPPLFPPPILPRLPGWGETFPSSSMLLLVSTGFDRLPRCYRSRR